MRNDRENQQVGRETAAGPEWERKNSPERERKNGPDRERKCGPDREKFERELDRLMESEEILKMQTFVQHSGNSTLQHVRNVAWRSFYLAERLGWSIDEKALARGAILHDYYLYNIREEGLGPYRHGTSHPAKALANAEKLYRLNLREKNIIESHMWPLTLFHPPLCREALLVCLADKYCAANEMVLLRKNLEKPRRVRRQEKQHE